MLHRSASIKNLLLAFCVSATAFSAQAQWVSIPDTNFGMWLNTNGYDMCLQGDNTVGWELDTTCNKVVSDTIVYCTYSGIQSIEGIQYFDKLKNLYCDANQLTSLPALPNSLSLLWCYKNMLTSLPALPNSLTILDCSQNQLTSLPTLPNSLIRLSFGINMVTSLPALPNTLSSLNCGSNQLTSIPTLPNNLGSFYCGINPLTSLPALPPTLIVIGCGFTQITSLPALPNSLRELVCESTPLTSLPALPNSLTYLNCRNCQLTQLPPLPVSVRKLYCNDNQLNSLPALPDSLDEFYCYENPLLSCLPKLGVVKALDFSGTSISCLPNYPLGNTSSNPPLNSVPLCDVFNANGCEVFYNISGTVYSDSIQNCIRDQSEKGSRNIKILLSRNGVLEQQSTSNNFSQYSFDTDNDTFEIRIDTTGLSYAVACPSTLFHTSILTPQDSMDMDNDFGLRCKPGFDLAVYSAVRDSGALFPAQKAGIRIKAGDVSRLYGLNCVSGIGGKVVVIYSGPVTYSGVRPGALTPAVTGKTLTYTIADFGTIDINTAFGLIFLTDTFAQIGQQLCLSITVIPDVAGDLNNTNNTLRICFPIVNSYDPNMKEVSPVNAIAPTEDWLTYTIHFQNMGNAPAIHIYVMDTLDNNLDESSIQILGSSHRMLIEIKGNIARFNFPNINLVDSLTDKELSKGWLQYKIKKNTGLALGTQIKNTASIYFDFNAPVVTNTVTNTVEEPSAVKDSRSQLLDINVFPNPTNDAVYISYSSNTSAEVTLFNINGAACLEQQLTASNQSISLSGLPAGVYFVSVEIQGSVVRKKVVKW